MLKLPFSKTAFRALGGSALTLLLSGCALGTMDMSGPVPASGGLNVQGRAFGGDQPVVGASIKVYAAGTTGYGTGGTLLSNGKTIITDNNGGFTITGDYSCTGVTTPVFVIASGGNPGGNGTNADLALITTFPSCTALQNASYVWINEVTTAATAYVMGPYFTTTYGGNASIGAPNTTQAQLGLLNAANTFNTLVNSANGQAVQSKTLTGQGVTITVTPEYQKLNTMADILASCINSNGGTSSTCQTTLFPDTTSSYGTPGDTLQAAVSMSLNPTSNVPALYGLTSSYAPYPGLSSAPTDFTLGVLYTDTSSTAYLTAAQNLSIDSYGNVWVLSNNGGPGSLVEFSPTGTPIGNVSTLNQWGPWATGSTTSLTSPKSTTTTLNMTNVVAGTSFGQAANNPSINPRNMTIDPSNNVWFTQSSGANFTTGGSNGTTTEPVSGGIFEVVTSSGTPTGTTFGFNTGKSSYGITSDGSGNIFVSQESSSAYFQVYEFPYSSTAGNAFLTPVMYPMATSTPGTAGTSGTNSYELEYMSFDSAGNLWMTGGSGYTSGNAIKLSNISLSAGGCGSLTQDSICQMTTSTSNNTYNIYSLSTATYAYQPAAGNGSMYTPSNNTNSMAITTNGGSTSVVGSSSSMLYPRAVAVDGAGNVWIANRGQTNTGAAATIQASVTETTSSGTILSPTSASSTPGYVHAGMSNLNAIAVDPSGNVWMANAVAAGNTDQNSIFELIGAAAPTVEPLSLQLKNSTIATKP